MLPIVISHLNTRWKQNGKYKRRLYTIEKKLLAEETGG